MKAQLELAFRWICPGCKTENFVNGHTRMGTEEEIRKEFGLQPYEAVPDDIGLEAMIAPEEVMCRVCTSVFETLDPMEAFPLDEEE